MQLTAGCAPSRGVRAGTQGTPGVPGSGSGGGGGGGGGCSGGGGGTGGSAADGTSAPGSAGSPGGSYTDTTDQVGLSSYALAPSGDGSVTIDYTYTPATLTNAPNTTSVSLGSDSATLTDTATLAGLGSQVPAGGTITFTLYSVRPFEENVSVDTETVSVTGNGAYTTPKGYTLKAAGIYQWGASYSGDGFNEPVSDLSDLVTVSGAAPTLSVAPKATSVQLGATSPTLQGTATLGGAFSPGGSITFSLYYGTTSVYTETVPVTGNETYTTTTGYTLPGSGTVTGTYQWDASYSGDDNNPVVSDNDDSAGQVTVSAAAPTLTTTPSPTSVSFGAATLNDTATLSGGFSPGGNITFSLYYEGTSVDTETVPVSGNGTYSTQTGYTLPTSGPATGAYQWDASYSGDDNNSAVSDKNDSAEQVTVNPEFALSTTTLNVASPAVTYGSESAETLTGTVFGPSGNGTPQGSVQVTSGGVTVCNATLSPGSGPDTAAYSCALSDFELPAGNTGVQVTYMPAADNSSSDPNYFYSGSGTSGPLTVNPAQAATSTTLSSSPQVTYGSEAAEVFTGTVAGLSGYGTPQGSVIVLSGPMTLCDAPLTPGPSGTATYICHLTASQVDAGTYPNVRAVYQPAGTSSSNPSVSYTDSVASGSFTVIPEAVSSTTTLNTSGPVIYGSETAETLSGTVSGPIGDGTPQGKVLITTSGGPATLCVAALTPGASDSATYSCTLTAAQLHAGNYSNVQAVYQPDPTSSANPDYTYNASSGSGSFTVNLATPVINWPNPASMVFGTLLSSTQLDATASVPGTFKYSPAAGTLLPPGSGQALQVTFTPTDGTDYSNATATVQLNVTSLACVTGTGSGSLTVGSGQAGCIKTGGTVPGSATVKARGALYMNGGTIKGALTVTGATAVNLCNVTIKGNLSISGSTGPIIVGGTGCTNTIQGSVSITGNTGGVTYLGNSATDSLTITGNSGPFNYIASDNSTSGKVTVSNNS